jgi:uncharacterized sodium:solute symporter family permease YidK
VLHTVQQTAKCIDFVLEQRRLAAQLCGCTMLLAPYIALAPRFFKFVLIEYQGATAIPS